MLIGVDLGGTQLRAARIEENGKPERIVVRPTGSEPGTVIGDAIEAIAELTNEPAEGARAIGVGATGPVDPRSGRVRNPYTLPGWHDVDLAGPLEERFGVPVFVENDADAAALGEHWVGAGRGVTRFLCVTVGTGIGTGFLVSGEIVRGSNSSHPEAGHHVIDPSGPRCYCGANGCWEVLASGPAIVRLAREDNPAPESELGQMLAADPDALTAEMVAEAATNGDPGAASVVVRVARYLALGLMNCIAFFLPDMIALGGSVMKSYGLFSPILQSTLENHDVMFPVESVKVQQGALGSLAGVIGAARVAKRGLA